MGEILQMGEAAPTRHQIQRAVVEAMADKDVDQITITEVCSACGIARSTFYRYYDSVDDVVKKTGDELLAAIRRVSSLDRYDAMKKRSPATPGQSDLARAQILKEYAPFIIAVTGFHGDPSFAHKATGVIREQLRETAGDSLFHQPYGDFLVEFLLAGLFRSIDFWLRNHPEMSAEEYYGLQMQVFEKFKEAFLA